MAKKITRINPTSKQVIKKINPKTRVCAYENGIIRLTKKMIDKSMVSLLVFFYL